MYSFREDNNIPLQSISSRTALISEKNSANIRSDRVKLVFSTNKRGKKIVVDPSNPNTKKVRVLIVWWGNMIRPFQFGITVKRFTFCLVSFKEMPAPKTINKSKLLFKIIFVSMESPHWAIKSIPKIYKVNPNEKKMNRDRVERYLEFVV